MYRVITKSMISLRGGGRKRQVDLGPWQTTVYKAQTWADYLERTGLYETVVVQSNGQGEMAAATGEEISL